MHKYSVQLRIYGETLDQERIEEFLGVRAFLYVRKGDPRGSKKIWMNSIWSYAGDVDEERKPKEWNSIEDGVRHITERLRIDKIIDCSNDYKMQWWCGHFQSTFDGGPEFSVDFINLLSRLGIPLYLDNYFSPES